MEEKEILEIIDKVASKPNLSSVEIENNGFRLVIRTDKASPLVMPAAEASCPPPVPAVSVPKPPEAAAAEIPSPSQEEDTAHFTETKLVKSPLVGTFYVAPSEEAEPFVKVGDRVRKGQTLAIVEAMKLMNDIECEYDGVVEAILVKNGDLVEYGQTLFRILEGRDSL